MIVGQAMCRFPTLVSPMLSCEQALALADERSAHFLLVVGGEELLGVVRACELRKWGPATLVGRTVREPVMTIAKTESVALAKKLLALGGAGCLVVIDGASCLHGTLTYEDLARSGAFRVVRGVDTCAVCGSAQHLHFANAEHATLCCHCLEAATRRDCAEPCEITLTSAV